MSQQVTFDEEPSVPSAAQTRANKPKGGLYALVVKLGLANSEREAEKVLIITAVLAIIIAIAYPFLFA